MSTFIYSSVYEIFPMMIPASNTSELVTAMANFSVTAPGPGRSATTQGGFQMLALVVTMIVAIVGGAITGL